MRTKDQLIEDFTKDFLKTFEYRLRREQFSFIDNGVDKKPRATQNEKMMYARSLAEI